MPIDREGSSRKCLPVSGPVGPQSLRRRLRQTAFSARWTRRTVNVTRTEEVQAIRERAKMLAVAAD